MKRPVRKHLATLAAAVALTIVAATAWAYWSAGSVAGGNGAAAAASVNQGATPTANAAGTTVTVSWAASTLSTGGAVAGYLVKRYDAGTLAPQTVLSACTGTITALTCVESNVPDGSWKYTVTPVFATNWQGLESAMSATANVARRPVVTATVANLAFTENGSAVALDAGITVTDADSNLTGATVSMTTNYVSGQDTLSFSTQNGITGSWVAGTGVLTLTGTTTAANYQTALRSITYSNTADNLTTNNHTVDFVASDAVGAGNTSSRQIAVTAVNDAPLNSVPGTQTTIMGTAKVFSTANSNLISVSDVDATTVRVQLVSTLGATTLFGTMPGALTFTVGDGTADATMTFSGTKAAVNTALDGMSFNPNGVGTASLQVVTSDLGATGSGGTLTDTDTVTINVVEDLGIFTAHQDIGGPSIAGSSSHSAGTYTVSGSGADIWGPPDQFQYLTVPMTGNGRLTARVVSDTTPHAAAKAGVMVRNTLASGSVHALMNITASNGSEYIARTVDSQPTPYANSTGGPNAPYWVRITRIGNTFTGEYSADGITWTKQGIPQTITMGATAYFGLAVTAHTNAALHTATFDNVSLTVPNAPVLTASGGTTAHTENVPVAVDTAITVTDADDANMASGTVTVGSGYTAGQDVLAFATQNGITGSYSAPTLTLTGSATKANWQTALRSITYNNTSDAPNTGNRTINFVVNDGSSNSNTAAKTVSVAEVNDAPANTVPGAQTTAANTAKVFSSGNANLISVSDADATTVQVQLVSTNGATTLFGTMPGSLTFTVGDGTADATMTFSGTKAAVNTALNGLSFNPTAAFSGAASLQIVTSDLGATGTGGTLTDNDTVAITVATVRPVVTATVANLAFAENGSAVALDPGITVTDGDGSDLTGATVSMTTNYVNGQDTLSVATQLGISGSWNAGTGVLTLTGTATAANYQTVMRSIMYSNTADSLVSNNRNVNFVASDATGAGNTSSRQIAVTAVNDGPLNTVPGVQATFMNTAKVFSGGNGNSITIADLDASPANMRVQLVSTNGTTTLFGTMPGALTFSVGDGTADATMTFDGTISAVNTALNGLSFNPTTSFLGAASLQIVTSDLGNTGSGGTLTDSDTVTINVAEDLGIFTAHQDIGVPPGTAGSASHSAATYTVAGSGWDIWDIDDHFQFLSVPMTGDGRLTARVVSQTQTPTTSNAAKAGVMFRQTMAVGSIHGMMGVTKANGSAFTYRKTTNAASGLSGSTVGIAAPYWVRMTRVGNVVTSERSPDGVTWTQQGANETITMGSTIFVGLAVSSVDTTKLNTATFDNVSLDLPPVLAASGGTTAHTENVPVAVDAGITVTDPGSTNMTAGTVTVGSGYQSGHDVLAFTNQLGITGNWVAGTGVLTLTGSTTKANWQTALRSITYNNTSDAPNTGNRTINFVVNDGAFTSNPAAQTVSIAPVNDAPVNSVPGAQTTAMNTAEVFSTGNGNLISITDADAAGGTMQVQLVSTNGTTTLSTLTGLTFSVGDGTADATMTFTGSFGAVNTALSGLSFNPTTSFTGAASLQIVTADQGNTGSGGTLTDSDTITINVAASGRPVVTATVANLAYTENASATVLDAGITVTDSDSNIAGATISMTTNYVNGQDTLAFSSQNGITGSWVASTGVLTLSGSATPAFYQTALRTITYVNSSQNPATSNRNVNFVASDAGGASNTSSRQVAVTAVNDAPVNTVPGAQTTVMNTPEVFSSGNGSLISVADVDAATVQVQLVSTNGATTLFGAMPGSLTFSVGDGTADATMTFTGTIANVNTALNGLSFNPTTSLTGAASLQIVTSDLGATGTGGTLTDNDTIAITVANDLGIFTANQDVGGPSIAGSSSFSSGTYTVSGSGADIWGTADQFQYLTVPMTGDGRLTARVVTDTNPHAGAKAGVMMRNSLTAGSVHALMNVMAANGTEFMARTVDSQTPSYATSTPGLSAPYWVRITRVGNTFKGERSSDGVTWTQEGTAQTVTMGSTIYVGLAVGSHTNAALHTATFDNVAITAAPTYFDTIWGESSLLNYYRMDDSSGTAIDDIETANNNGTYFGSPTKSQAGAIAGNNAVLFDGVDDYGSMARQIQDDFSIEFWFKSTQSYGTTCTQWWQGAGLVDAEFGGQNTNDFGVTLCQGKVIGGVGGGSEVSVASSGTYNNGAWHHVVFTRTKATGALALYVDGAAAGTATGSTVSLTATTNINLGRLATAIQYYAGSLDEVALYNTVLSAGTISAHYAAR